MFLIDTNVISEADKADAGIRASFRAAAEQQQTLFLSVVSLGELWRGVELIRYRGDAEQVALLEHWLRTVVSRRRPSDPRS